MIERARPVDQAAVGEVFLGRGFDPEAAGKEVIRLAGLRLGRDEEKVVEGYFLPEVEGDPGPQRQPSVSFRGCSAKSAR
jgi:hypothetical protein